MFITSLLSLYNNITLGSTPMSSFFVALSYKDTISSADVKHYQLFNPTSQFYPLQPKTFTCLIIFKVLIPFLPNHFILPFFPPFTHRLYFPKYNTFSNLNKNSISNQQTQSENVQLSNHLPILSYNISSIK